MNRYVIGIDTGGTFTDGVLLDYSSRRVVSSAKTLTTRKDLKQGVIRVLQKLNIQEDYSIKLVGISSTLATNSIAEGKARKVGLVLLGYNQKLIENYGLRDNLSTEDIAFFSGGHNAQGVEMAPVDEEGIRQWVKDNQSKVDAIAVSSYFSPMNPEHELKALDIIQKESDLPLVMGHQLSTKLDSIKRAATASINASLVAVMQDFIQSVRHSLKELSIEAPLMIVRGDGTLMPYNEAVYKPVETVLSGPAASAIGGIFLSGKKESLVIDMGSTTTDMALVENSRVVVSEEGARVGETETAVEAARIRTVSIGCDSRISFDKKNELQVGPERVRALSQMAITHPKVAAEIRKLKNDPSAYRNEHDLEYWYLHRSPDDSVLEILDASQRKMFDRLKEPTKLSILMEEFGVYHPSHLNLHDFIRQGYIECASLNPSDLLHVRDDMDLWDKEVAEIATGFIADEYGLKKKALIDKAFTRIVDIIVEEMLIYLACQQSGIRNMPSSIDGQWGKWMLREILNSDNDYLSVELKSRFPVIGTGAPARHFLNEVVRCFHNRLIIPEFSEVANAVGAVSGSITEVREALVFIRESEDSYTYQVKYNGSFENFDTYEEACEHAENISHEKARDAAVEAGSSTPYVETQKKTEGSLTRFVSRAIGNPRLSRQEKKINS
ncbi:MAG: hydantoinase/oxoprolinase family protein [Bacteroidales bacterium]|nr:hydantoinase/oxoprolinase family protein [Bacteroidales bacterium]